MRPGAVSGATRALRCRVWHEAYDAPCGGSGRYVRPAVPWLARGTCGRWPMMSPGGGAVSGATRAL
eukprot:3439034-Prymnesium_polylepis.1